ncbi:MAG: 16S rRNA (uracil(1498)-N(3))-methyltransferase [Planctomycetota bacterium]|nr:16S rRNA (uracil(1498)-N(3))-methyltransferase [Planctomycetota bacterium]MDG2143412.1 16S rRNA (uracil(1498)-N(3))-methyltransferase [Planctomycetota bacterium]
MNLILLHPEDLCEEGVYRLRGRRFEHIRHVHRADTGATLRVGFINGDIGTGVVLELSDKQATLAVTYAKKPPAALPLTLILGLPRPRMLKRTLQTVAAMGVKKIVLLNGYRVEKSYWQTPILTAEGLAEHLHLGLEQAVDTVLPKVVLQRRFKPFVEDELPAIAEGTRGLVAHPYDAQPLPAAEKTPTTLAIGPEGGFIPYEIQKLREAGLEPVHMGPRILRVETAVPSLLSRLFPIT